MKKLMALAFIIPLLVVIAEGWVVGSLVASGVKTISKDCGKVYGIEKLVSADWFCPEEEKNE